MLKKSLLPNKSTGGLFVTAKIKALALIKANAIYAVSCYTSRRIFSAHFLRTPALLVDEGEERAWCEAGLDENVVVVAGGAGAPSLSWVVGSRRSLRILAKPATTPVTHVELVKLSLL